MDWTWQTERSLVSSLVGVVGIVGVVRRVHAKRWNSPGVIINPLKKSKPGVEARNEYGLVSDPRMLCFPFFWWIEQQQIFWQPFQRWWSRGMDPPSINLIRRVSKQNPWLMMRMIMRLMTDCVLCLDSVSIYTRPIGPSSSCPDEFRQCRSWTLCSIGSHISRLCA